jgi:3-methyladenine DNA glycosylase Tag
MNSQKTLESNRLLHMKFISIAIDDLIRSDGIDSHDAVNALMAVLCERLKKIKCKHLATTCVRQLAVVIGMIDRETKSCPT